MWIVQWLMMSYGGKKGFVPWANTVAYYKMDWNANDSSWNGRNGTDDNISYVPGRFWQWWSFNGSTSIIRLPNNFQNNFSWWLFTISAFVKPASFTGTVNSIFKNRGDATTWAVHFDLTNSKVTLYITQSNWTMIWALQSAAKLSTGIWYHVWAVADWTNINIYLNWNNVGSRAYNWTLKTSFIYNNIWCKVKDTWVIDVNQSFNWLIDEVIIENVAWSATEVQEYYNLTNKYNTQHY